MSHWPSYDAPLCTCLLTGSTLESKRSAQYVQKGHPNQGLTDRKRVYVVYTKWNVSAADALEKCVILNCIKSFSQSDQDPEEYLEKVFKCLVNANFDSVPVMSGYVSGVQTWLKKRRDGLIYKHCVAHLLEFAVLDAIKFEDTYLEKFDNTLSGMFKYYYRSAVRQNKLSKKTIGESIISMCILDFIKLSTG